MYGIIYKVTNIQNNKIYIGQTTRSLEERKYHHFYRADHELEITHTHFINAIRKYGKDAFQWEQIDQADSQQELNNKEIYWIDYYDSINHGYNIQEGGNQSKSEKFLLSCGCRPFLFFKVNGEFLGRFLSQKECADKYLIAATHISDLVNNRMTSCNGYIAILEEDFTQKILQEKIKNSKQTFRPFIAVNIKTLEQFGPFTTMKSCQEFFGFKSNHISEVLSGKRQSQNGYTFKFVD